MTKANSQGERSRRRSFLDTVEHWVTALILIAGFLFAVSALPGTP